MKRMRLSPDSRCEAREYSPARSAILSPQIRAVDTRYGPRRRRRGPRAQQPQLRQVQGLQRQPPLVQLQVQAALVSFAFFMVVLLCLPYGESRSSSRTMVRSQA